MTEAICEWFEGDDWQYESGWSKVQPLIRCKDCKYRDPEDHKCDCGHDIRWQLPREDNWFCADAERKEE